MFFVWLILSCLLIAEAVITLINSLRFRRFYCRDLATIEDKEKLEALPKVALLAPCKGVDEGLRENIQTWFSQDYSNYSVFFMVESEQDPAVPIIQEFPGHHIFYTGEASDCGQKVHNLKFAIERLPAEFEVFAFIDSDCRIRPDWLINLIVKLLQNVEGAVTSYRWFEAEKGLASTLRAVWNSSVVTVQSRSRFASFAWGGSTAIFRNAFESARVLEYWRGSISDDYSLTHAMHKSGRSIVFVPASMAMNYEKTNMAHFLSWVSRQLLITKFYNRKLWTQALLFHAVWFIWVVIGMVAFPFPFVLLFLLLWLVQIIKAEIRLDLARRIFADAGNRFVYWLLSPVIALINFGVLVYTCFAQTVRWRGKTYVGNAG